MSDDERNPDSLEAWLKPVRDRKANLEREQQKELRVVLANVIDGPRSPYAEQVKIGVPRRVRAKHRGSAEPLGRIAKPADAQTVDSTPVIVEPKKPKTVVRANGSQSGRKEIYDANRLKGDLKVHVRKNGPFKYHYVLADWCCRHAHLKEGVLIPKNVKPADGPELKTMKALIERHGLDKLPGVLKEA